MCRIWLICRGEAECCVKVRTGVAERAETDPLEMTSGVFDQEPDERLPHPLSSPGGMDVDVTNAAYGRIVYVWVDIDTTDTTESTTASHLRQHLTGAVEPIGAVAPLLDKPRDQVVALILGGSEEYVDVRRQLGYRTGLCDHGPIV